MATAAEPRTNEPSQADAADVRLPGRLRLVAASVFTPVWSSGLLLCACFFLPLFMIKGCDTAEPLYPYQWYEDVDSVSGLFAIQGATWSYLFGLLVAVGTLLVALTRHPRHFRTLWTMYAVTIVVVVLGLWVSLGREFREQYTPDEADAGSLADPEPEASEDSMAPAQGEDAPSKADAASPDAASPDAATASPALAEPEPAGDSRELWNEYFWVLVPSVLLLALLVVTYFNCRTWFAAALWIQLALACLALAWFAWIAWMLELLVGGKLSVAACTVLVAATVVERLRGLRALGIVEQRRGARRIFTRTTERCRRAASSR